MFKTTREKIIYSEKCIFWNLWACFGEKMDFEFWVNWNVQQLSYFWCILYVDLQQNLNRSRNNECNGDFDFKEFIGEYLL